MGWGLLYTSPFSIFAKNPWVMKILEKWSGRSGLSRVGSVEDHSSSILSVPLQVVLTALSNMGRVSHAPGHVVLHPLIDV